MKPREMNGMRHWRGVAGLGFLVGWVVILAAPSVHAENRMYLFLGSGGGLVRYGPLGQALPRAETGLDVVLHFELSLLPGWLAVGFGPELTTMGATAFTTSGHQSLDLYLRASVPVFVLRHLYGGVGGKWLRVRTVDPLHDVSEETTGFVPLYFAGLQARVLSLYLRLEYQWLQGKVRVDGRKFRYRKQALRLLMGFRF